MCLALFCYAWLCVNSSFAIILKRKRKLALLLLSYRCLVAVNVLWLFLAVMWVGLQCVIVVFPDHTHLFFCVCLVLQSSCWGRESWLLWINCLLNALWQSVFCGSSSLWRGLVCGVWLWYFLIILTCFFMHLQSLKFRCHMVKEKMHIQENTLFNLDLGSHEMLQVPFTSCKLCTGKVCGAICTSNSWQGDAFTRKYIMRPLTFGSRSNISMPSILYIMWPMHLQILKLLCTTVKEVMHWQETGWTNRSRYVCMYGWMDRQTDRLS